MRKTETWVLQADVARARVVRKPERALDMAKAPMETIFEAGAEHRPLRDIMTDALARSFASVSVSRSARKCHSDPVSDETRKFARSLLSDSDAHLALGDFEQLVISASPRMLGALWEVMPERLAAVVNSEDQATRSSEDQAAGSSNFGTSSRR